MCKHILICLFGCLLFPGLRAQSPAIDGILRDIGQNNKELQALEAYIAARRAEWDSENGLPAPQAGAYYLPFGNHTGGDYSEFELSQSFEFPSVYGARKNVIRQQTAQLELEYRTRRQELLATAWRHCLELVYLEKQRAVEQERMEQARRVYEQVRESYEREQVGILELNKAKVAWMQDQFRLQQLESDRQNLLLALQNLNGGTAVSFGLSEYGSPPDLAGRDSLWQERLRQDPALARWKQREVIEEGRLALSKKMSLPDLTAGLNGQGVAGSYHSGFFVGLSLPLWTSGKKIDAAQSRIRYRQSDTDARTRDAYASFEKQYNEYRLLLRKYREYSQTLSALDSDDLLLQAYRLGEISFVQYYMELQFYRQAFDAMLDMEFQLHRLQADILKFKL